MNICFTHGITNFMKLMRFLQVIWQALWIQLLNFGGHCKLRDIMKGIFVPCRNIWCLLRSKCGIWRQIHDGVGEWKRVISVRVESYERVNNIHWLKPSKRYMETSGIVGVYYLLTPMMFLMVKLSQSLSFGCNLCNSIVACKSQCIIYFNENKLQNPILQKYENMI